MTKTGFTSIKTWALAGAASLAIAQGAAFAQDQKIEFDIDPAPLGDALNEFGLQSGKEILFVEAETDGKTTKGVEGTYEPDTALDLLLNGSGIDYRTNGLGTVLVGTVAMRRASYDSSDAPQLVLAQVQDDERRDVTTVDDRDDEDEEARREDVIVVTGTYIRGANPASPVTVITRDDIDRAGITSTQQLLRNTVQNFDLGENTAGSRAGSNDGAPVGTSGVNLRGLGAGSTLTLVNGRRIAPGGGAVEFVDLNLIPLAAVERVEILTDGASATYGADAVAGIVNFILREDFDGFETRASVGGVIEGSSQLYQVSQTAGRSWNSGNILGTYEYLRRNNLDSNDRSFSELAADPTDLIAGREQHSGFVTFNQDLSSQVKLFGDGMYSSVSTSPTGANFVGATALIVRTDRDSEQYGGNLGLAIDLSNDWSSEILGSYSQSTSESDQFQDRTLTTVSDSEFKLAIAEARASGPVFSVPGGALQLALGGQFRNEAFVSNSTAVASGNSIANDLDRDIFAFFAEAQIPLVSDQNRKPGIERLEVSAAVRYEDYSDFGGTTNPKFGIVYSPHESLILRGTYGTSFQAPRFDELAGDLAVNVLPGFIFAPLPDGSPAPDSMLLFGGNLSLEPEEAESWTIGVDWTPDSIDGFEISITYYSIDFDGRINRPNNGSAVRIFDPVVLNPQFLDTDPASDRVEGFFASPNVANFFAVAPSDIGAIADLRLQNVSSTEVSGMDFSVEYSQTFDVGDIQVGLNGSFIDEFTTQVTSMSDPFDDFNRFSRPVDLKLRGNIGWSRGRLSANAFFNYTDGYESDETGVIEDVDSWFTTDVSLAYAVGAEETNGLLKNSRVSLVVDNHFQ